MEDSTSILFGLPGVAVREVERVGDARVVHVITVDPAAAACPECGVFSQKVRQRRTTRPKDLGYGEEPLTVRWDKAQYACEERLCPRKAFTESIAELPPRARVTGRLRRAAACMIAGGSSVAATVREHGVSWPIAHEAFALKADAELAAPAPTARLGIDETRRGRPRWHQDPDTFEWEKLELFETNFVDLTGMGGLLGQASGRTKKTVIEWLDEQGQEWKDTVEVVAIDPCATYRRAVTEALPNALIVADHFHLTRLGNQAVTEVRQRVVRETAGRRGRASDPIWAGRRRLLRGAERLTPKAFEAMITGLTGNDPTGQILIAWVAKEELRALLACAKSGGQRHDIAHRLDRFYTWCAGAGADIAEVQRLAATVDAWWPQILGFLHTDITNAATEGTNRLIKDAARCAFGFRNLANQRRRVRWACTRRQRQLTTK